MYQTTKKNVAIWKKTCKGNLRQVLFIRVYRLEIQSVMLYFRPIFVNCCPSNLPSGSTLPPPSVWISTYTVYTLHVYSVLERGVWGSGPQTDKHLPQSPFTGSLFLDEDILHCLLWVLSVYGGIPDGGVEPLAVLENVEGERHFHALPLLLDAQQGALQVQPERDLLRIRRGQSHVTFHQEITWKKTGQRLGGPGWVKTKRSVLLLQSMINCFFYFVFI